MKNKNKRTAFSTSIPASLSNFQEGEKLSTAMLKVFHKGRTADGRVFTDAFAEKLARTIGGTPVVAKYNSETDDFEGHAYNQSVFGYVPEFAYVDYETDAMGHEWLVTEVKLFTGRQDVGYIAKKIIGKEQSLELNPETVGYDYDQDTGDITLYEGDLIGLSVLGSDQSPAFAGSGFFTAIDNEEVTLEELIDKYLSFETEIEIEFEPKKKKKEDEDDGYITEVVKDKEVEVDKSGLIELMGKDISGGIYTDNTYEEIRLLKEEANELLGKEGVTQKELDDVAKKLEDLYEQTIDRTPLNDALEALSNVDTSQASPESNQAFQDRMDELSPKIGDRNLSQEEINALAQDILDAIDLLEPSIIDPPKEEEEEKERSLDVPEKEQEDVAEPETETEIEEPVVHVEEEAEIDEPEVVETTDETEQEEEIGEPEDESSEEQEQVDSQTEENFSDSAALNRAEREELNNYRRETKKQIIASYAEFLSEEDVTELNETIDNFDANELEREISFRAMQAVKKEKAKEPKVNQSVQSFTVGSYFKTKETSQANTLDENVAVYLNK